jgi:Meiotically up-regulated gene 113
MRMVRLQYAVMFVYFVENSQSGYIKIGLSKNIRARMSSLSSSSGVNLRLLCYLETDKAEELERELHDRFAKDNVSGEWYRNCTGLRDYIETVQAVIRYPVGQVHAL